MKKDYFIFHVCTWDYTCNFFKVIFFHAHCLPCKNFSLFWRNRIGEIAIARNSLARSSAVMFAGKWDLLPALVFDARESNTPSWWRRVCEICPCPKSAENLRSFWTVFLILPWFPWPEGPMCIIVHVVCGTGAFENGPALPVFTWDVLYFSPQLALFICDGLDRTERSEASGTTDTPVCIDDSLVLR